MLGCAGAFALVAASGCGVAGVANDLNVGPDHSLTTDSTVTQSVRAINLTNAAGTVSVHAGGSVVVIHRKVDYHFSHQPTPGQTLSNGTLTLTSGCTDCAISYDLTVPASVGLTIENDAGSVTLTGVSGQLDIQTNTGKVTGTGIGSPVAKVTDSAGPIELGFVRAPGQVTAQDEAGAVTVTVPGGPYRVNASSSAGKSSVNVPTSPDARATLVLSSEVGNVTVNPAGGSAGS